MTQTDNDTNNLMFYPTKFNYTHRYINTFITIIKLLTHYIIYNITIPIHNIYNICPRG